MRTEPVAFKPAYISLHRSGELAQRARAAMQGLQHCDVCAWECGANRLEGKIGVCRTGCFAYISSYGPHHGEEPPLSGWRGSGTLFFSHCNLHCVYCQNYDISQFDRGKEVEPAELAGLMLDLQHYGCHNINLVSPSHVVPQILTALCLAVEAGLRLPLVYNTGGYDSLATLSLLDGIVDIYMPDMKYADAKLAQIYSGIPHYPQSNQAAVREMHRQVGDLTLDENGIATRGLLVRHLILPNGIAGTPNILKFLAEEISLDTYLNLMDQYYPAYQAFQHPELNRRITHDEYALAVKHAEQLGFTRLCR